ncbi:MAG: class I SAM-dependent methyltransferase [Methanotrichaceae archaeon]
MDSNDPWTAEYLEEKFTNPDPWKYFTSSYEQIKYRRQLDVILDRRPNPQKILEIGPAEGAYTIMLADQFPSAQITGIDLTAHAIERARENLRRYGDRIKLVNADIIKYEPMLEDCAYDICIWSESIYYIGAQVSLNKTYKLLKKIIGKLLPGGILIMANTVDLPEDIPESAITERPIIDCYYNLISSLIGPVLKTTYTEDKYRRIYEYQIWAFER